VDHVHVFFNPRINMKIIYFLNFAERPLDFFETDPQSIVITKKPLEFGK
jgi:hypothetical protein